MGRLEKARLVSQEDGADLRFHYNPATITMRTGARFSRPRPARGEKTAPPSDFVSAEQVVYTMDIVLDATDDEKRKVPEAITRLVDWTRPSEASLKTRKPAPPLLLLEWGSRHWGPVHLTKLRVDHTLFSPEGEPVRAKANLRLTEKITVPGRTNPTSGGSPDRRRVLVEGSDGLGQVAQREYGDPNLWRAVAAANGIDDPLRVPRGTQLLLPPAWEAREAEKGRRGA
jgi:nucleoid-associated protein YgaU